MALNYTLTQYALILDVDLIPSWSARANLKELVRYLHQQSVGIKFEDANHKRIESSQFGFNYSTEFIRSIAYCVQPGMHCAFVLPAFETTSGFDKYFFARTKFELYSQFGVGNVMVFQGKVCPQGHAPTNYYRWWHTRTPYCVALQDKYEPYVMVRVKSITHEDLLKDPTQIKIPEAELLFEQRFVGYGLNKVMFIRELDALGYAHDCVFNIIFAF